MQSKGARIRRELRYLAEGTALALAASAVGVLFLELALRLCGIDSRLVAGAPFLQAADLPVHRVSSDPFLHYELAPGARSENSGPRGIYVVSIDSFGARQPTHPGVKPPGTFRVLCFGGSTMYGAGVDDSQTIPAALEARLNRESSADGQGARRFEVWNFATPAYTLGQAAHLAERKLHDLDPDLIVVQHHNTGRRPFLGTADSRVADHPQELEHPDVDFFLEQFPIPDGVPIALHRDGLAFSALYRSLIAVHTHLFETRGYWPCDRCDRISAAKARALSRESEALGVPVVYVAIPADPGARPADIFPELKAERFIHLYRPGRESAFYEVHPPPAVLDEYAGLLANALRERGLLRPSTDQKEQSLRSRPSADD